MKPEILNKLDEVNSGIEYCEKKIFAVVNEWERKEYKAVRVGLIEAKSMIESHINKHKDLFIQYL